MTILDTSLLVPLVRPGADAYAEKLVGAIGHFDIHITAVSEMELLQGAADEGDWKRIGEMLAQQDILQLAPAHWQRAARTYFELRRTGLTVRSSLDCLIAEVAIGQSMMLLHNDRDFETISTLRPLQQRRLVL